MFSDFSFSLFHPEISGDSSQTVPAFGNYRYSAGLRFRISTFLIPASG